MSDVPFVLVLGTAEWDQAIATNQHYMVRELCRDGFARVDYIESLGLRMPQFSKRDLGRIQGRLRRAFSVQGGSSQPSWRARPNGLTVVSPLVVPKHRGPARFPNWLLLHHAVREWLAYPGTKILWTYSPVTYGLENHATRAFYHCVDLLAEFPGIDQQVIGEGERRLASEGVKAIASSAVVKAHLEGLGFDHVPLWENVADTCTIAKAHPEVAERIPGRVFFAGNLSPKKVDYSLLRALTAAGLKVAVAGPRAEGGGDDADDFDSLIAAGIQYLGMLTLDALAGELVTGCVGLIPYALNDYTRGVSPLKTFEYLAAGLAVVSTALPGVSASDPHVWVEHSAIDFVQRVKALSGAPSVEAVAARINIAERHSWVQRGAEARALVRGRGRREG